MSDLIDRQAAIDDIWTVSPLAHLDREWIDRWLRQLPPANNSEIPNSSDTISRAKAIETVETVGYDFSESELSEVELEEVCGAVSDVRQDMIDRIKQLPPAQPEIIRCKDCKHRDPEDKKCDCGHDIEWQLPRQDDWFCADAER